MRKLIAVTIALSTLAALTGPVAAQMTSGRQHGPTPMQADEAQRKKAAEKAQKEYEDTMRKTQGQGGDQTAVDPWANMRAVDGSQPKH